MKYQIVSLKQFFPAKGAVYYVAIATVIFSRVISRYHAFARKFTWYFIGVYINKYLPWRKLYEKTYKPVILTVNCFNNNSLLKIKLSKHCKIILVQLNKIM